MPRATSTVRSAPPARGAWPRVLAWLTCAAVASLVFAPPAGAAASTARTSKKAKGKAAKTALPAEAPPPAGPATPPADSSPMADLRKSHLAVKRLLQKKAPSWSPEHDVRNTELSKLVGGFLDFEELSRRALARHWDALPPPKRAEFVKTLRDLIERNYVTQIHGQPDYELRFDREQRTEQKSASEATVAAVLTAVARGKKVTVAIEYKLLWKGRWLVYDVVTDEQSLLENYRSEFNKSINKDGFDSLLGRMKKKLAAKSE